MSDTEGKSSVALGKRKQRDDELEQTSPHGSTLFVSNLPYPATSTDLQTLFSDIAPVRSAFVVTEHGTGTSKGVGYVSFAIKDDAKRALESIERDGLELLGRKLRVQLADKKTKDKKPDTTTEKPKKKAPRPHVSSNATKDPNAIRTIVISGVPQTVDQKVLWKKVRKYDGAESAELIGDGVAHATFKTPANATRAVEKLHAHVFKGAILSVTLKKRIETLTKATVKAEDSSSGAKVPAPSRGSRLIVRNLPFDISETDLRALFLPYGPIYSIHIPTAVESSSYATSVIPKTRGFAFVWFFSKKDAERAIESVNGKAVKAGAVARPTMNRKERARMRRAARAAKEGKESKKGEESEEGGDESGSDDGEGSDGEKEGKAAEVGGKERVVAVDWALSKEKWEKVKEEAADMRVDGDEASGGEEESDGDDKGEGSSAESESNSEEEDDTKAVEGNSDALSQASQEESASEYDMAEDDEERSDDDEERSKPALPKPEAGTTLFVRNLPFEATEDELRVLFRTFGPLRYARITIDHSTGRSRGTGFVCFWNKEDADKAVKQCELVKKELGVEAPKKNPFTLPTLLTPDPSSSLAQSLVLHGRTLDVTVAVTRDEAARLKDEGERAREKADKRNLWLLREGVIFPNSPAAATLPPAELEKRQASFTTRRNLLKSNPLLYISKTRLSVRQIPTYVSDKCLKKLAMYAVKAFEEEVKQGKREGISNEEKWRDDDENDAAEAGDNDWNGNEDDASTTKGKSRKRPSAKTMVKQAKIIRQSDRVDVLTNKLKSKGYGFVEMGKHTDALRVLRWVNNNPGVHVHLESWWRDELKEMIKNLESSMEKGGKGAKELGDATEVEARLKRLKLELEGLEAAEKVKARKGGKTMVVEFSIENSQVVKRRKAVQKERVEASKDAQATPRKRFIDDPSTPLRKRHKAEHGDSSKPRMLSLSNSKKEKEFINSSMRKGTAEKTKGGSKLGSIIGRKRKARSLKAGKRSA